MKKFGLESLDVQMTKGNFSFYWFRETMILFVKIIFANKKCRSSQINIIVTFSWSSQTNYNPLMMNYESNQRSNLIQLVIMIFSVDVDSLVEKGPSLCFIFVSIHDLTSMMKIMHSWKTWLIEFLMIIDYKELLMLSVGKNLCIPSDFIVERMIEYWFFFIVVPSQFVIFVCRISFHFIWLWNMISSFSKCQNRRKHSFEV